MWSSIEHISNHNVCVTGQVSSAYNRSSSPTLLFLKLGSQTLGWPEQWTPIDRKKKRTFMIKANRIRICKIERWPDLFTKLQKSNGTPRNLSIIFVWKGSVQIVFRHILKFHGLTLRKVWDENFHRIGHKLRFTTLLWSQTPLVYEKNKETN